MPNSYSGVSGKTATHRDSVIDEAEKFFRISASEELLALAEEAGRVGLFEWHVKTGSLHLSANFLSIYGIEDFDGRYQSWLKCVHREDVVRVEDIIENAFAEKRRDFSAEFRIVRSGGALSWIESRSIAFYDEQGAPVRVVGVNVDITERKRTLGQMRAFTESLEDAVRERTRELEVQNAARLKAEELLRQAQKMEAVGQLTGGIAHDFNNLLTIVIGGLDTIARQIALIPASPALERVMRARDMASEGAKRAASLTSRLLAFSRRQPLEPQPINVNALIKATGELLHRSLGEDISLETVLGSGLWLVHADANQLENALLNLAINARDAMPGGGMLTVETANCYLDEAYVAEIPEPVSAGQYAVISVSDTGSGMDRATLEKAIEPFFTTKEVGKGSGLGLSQVYGFIRQSSGHVQIYSEVGQGTTVKIYLPRYVGLEKLVAEDKPSGLPRAIGQELILLVEDDAPLRRYTAEILTELGYEVLSAPNAAAALEILARRTDVDLLFTDVIMPGGINGRQLADSAVKQHPGLKVVFTTGYTRNAVVHHGRLDPGVHLLGKPYSFDELARKLRCVLDGKAAIG